MRIYGVEVYKRKSKSSMDASDILVVQINRGELNNTAEASSSVSAARLFQVGIHVSTYIAVTTIS